jgi:hypothetical protein
MSKKNRYKFRNREANRDTASGNSVSTAPVSSAFSSGSGRSDGAFAQHTAEYRTINMDLIRLVVLNGIMLIAVFALYYVNRSSGTVERMVEHLLKLV